MPVLLRIAFRNLLEHKSKSFIIGGLLALGVVILIVGNAFMDTAAQGVKDTFIANYTGDIFISAKAKTPVSLFGAQSMGDRETTESIPNYDEIAEHLKSTPGVLGVTSQVTGFGLAALKDAPEKSGDDDTPGFALLFGIDASTYYKLFTTAKAVQGHLLAPGEEGLVVSKATLERFKKSFGVEPKIGDQILLTGMGKAGFKIRSVPLTGIIAYKSESEATDFISYADVNTVRILSGLTLGNDEGTPVTEEQKDLLASSGDDLFGGETVVSEAAAAPKALPQKAATLEKKAAPQVDAGAWHFMMARLDDPAKADAVVVSLNLWFAQEGIEAQASGWKVAAGPFAQSIDVVRIVFNIAIIIVAIVAIIIMMNTLVISVIERTGEIGTMRALGAQKGFVRRMFLIEALTIAVVFGFAGTILAFGTVGILNVAHITATNPFLKILFAGDVLHPSVKATSVIWSLVLVSLVAVIAHLYPVSLALKVQPVRAMQTE